MITLRSIKDEIKTLETLAIVVDHRLDAELVDYWIA
jgi:hypothetical protein